MSNRKASLAALTISTEPVADLSGRPGGTRPGRLAHNRLVPSPNQPRKHFSDQSILELAADIATQGQLMPLLVRSTGPDGRHMIVAGERRWRAMAKIDAYGRGERLVEVTIDHNIADDDAAYDKALSENLQRDDLTRAEVGVALLNRKERYSLTNAELARRFHKSEAWVDQHLRYAQLPEATRSLMDKLQVDLKVAGVIARVPEEAQADLVHGLEGIGDRRGQVERARTARTLHEQGLSPAEAVERAASVHLPADPDGDTARMRGADPSPRRGRPRSVSIPFTLDHVAAGPPRVQVNPRALTTSRLLAGGPLGPRRWLEAVAADLAAFRDLCASHASGELDWALVEEIVKPVVAD